MKFIIAPDSFKGCLRSIEVCQYLADGIRQVCPDAEIIKLPMADGGEGSVEAVISATNGKLISVDVHNPLGEKIEAHYGILGNGKTAIMEMASASGIELLDTKDLNPWLTTTYGTGEIIKSILKSGIRDIIIGIGGSATNDGGAGMVQALGYQFENAVCGCSGGGLGDITGINAENVIPELKDCRIRVACDVNNPLLGAKGATKVYSAQKGADKDMQQKLEVNMEHYASVLKQAGFADDCKHPSDGAAGGLGFALRTLAGGEMVSGAELIIDISGLKENLAGADILITGEGCTDFQTAHGKICAVIAQTAKEANVPAVLVSGALLGDLSELSKLFKAMFSTTSLPCDLEEAFAQTPANLVRMGRNIAGLIK
jgi:glycerate 2-kinase